MDENTNMNNAPEGTGDKTLEVSEPGGTRRPMSQGEMGAYAAAMRARAAVPDPADQRALDEIRKRDDAATAKEAEARARGEESWRKLFEKGDGSDAEIPKPGGLDLEVPLEVPQQFYEQTAANVAQAAAIAQEMNIPHDEAQFLVDHAVALAVSDESGVNLADQDGCMGVLMRRYGNDEGEKIVLDAQAAVVKLGPKASEFLNSTGLGNSPAVLAALAEFHRGSFRMSAEKAQAELSKMSEDLRSAYRNTNHSGHKAAVDRANLLYQIIARGDAKAGEKASGPATKKSALPSPANAKKASLERELQAAINDPDYRKSGPKHAAAVARVEALYREMYPGNRNDEGEDV